MPPRHQPSGHCIETAPNVTSKMPCIWAIKCFEGWPTLGKAKLGPAEGSPIPDLPLHSSCHCDGDCHRGYKGPSSSEAGLIFATITQGHTTHVIRRPCVLGGSANWSAALSPATGRSTTSGGGIPVTPHAPHSHLHPRFLLHRHRVVMADCINRRLTYTHDATMPNAKWCPHGPMHTQMHARDCETTQAQHGC